MQTGAADHSRILAKAAEWAGAPMALATVIETWRSAPCPVGTHMLVHKDGAFVGSVSGGCVEGDVLHVAAEIIAGALIFPNPANPKRYIVINSGFTFREAHYLTNAQQTPKLPDWAVVDLSVPPSAYAPGKIAAAGFFGERWELKAGGK